MSVRNWLRRRWGPPVRLWHHPAFRVPARQAPLPATRAEDAATWLLDRRVLRASDLSLAPEVDLEALTRVHPLTYLTRLEDPVTLAEQLGVPPGSWSAPAALELFRRATGATLAAARWARRTGGRAAVTSGGFHHAYPERGAGFCLLNDVAVAVRALRQEGLTGRITVLDLDAHPPDGVVACLGDDPALDVLSLSAASNWSLPPAAAARVRDARVEAPGEGPAWLAALEALLAERRPSALTFLLLGADPLRGDPMGGLDVPEATLRAGHRRALEQEGPLVLLPAGGYTPRAWAVLAGAIAEAAGVPEHPAPDYRPLERRFGRIARTLDPEQLGGVDREWAEIAAELHLPVTEPRFLGYYTRYGLELALEAYGLLPALRGMGFRDLTVSLEAQQEPHRVLVRAGEEALIDLSARRLRQANPGGETFDLLFLDWLELRDPRPAARPLLPGQRAPGLGLSAEVVALTLAAARRLELDGVGFLPAHYHVAVMAGSRFAFLDPAAGERFRHQRERARGLPLEVASRRLDPPGVDGEVWVPALLCAPVSPRLAQALGQPGAEGEASGKWPGEVGV